jgi:hypothetical protein
MSRLPATTGLLIISDKGIPWLPTMLAVNRLQQSETVQ